MLSVCVRAFDGSVTSACIHLCIALVLTEFHATYFWAISLTLSRSFWILTVSSKVSATPLSWYHWQFYCHSIASSCLPCLLWIAFSDICLKNSHSFLVFHFLCLHCLAHTFCPYFVLGECKVMLGAYREFLSWDPLSVSSAHASQPCLRTHSSLTACDCWEQLCCLTGPGLHLWSWCLEKFFLTLQIPSPSSP